jgi:hypothetical protein
MFEFKMEGFDELEKRLDELHDQADQIRGTQEVPLDELLNPGFLAKYSRFLSYDEMFEESGIRLKSQDDFANLPDGELDKVIQQNTTFATWQDMVSAAAVEWFQKKIR